MRLLSKAFLQVHGLDVCRKWVHAAVKSLFLTAEVTLALTQLCPAPRAEKYHEFSRKSSQSLAPEHW